MGLVFEPIEDSKSKTYVELDYLLHESAGVLVVDQRLQAAMTVPGCMLKQKQATGDYSLKDVITVGICYQAL